MIVAEKSYRGDCICPLCTGRFDIDADEDSNYDGASTEILCPICYEELIIDTVTRYEVSINRAKR